MTVANPENIKSRNWKILEQRWPYIWEEISKAPSFENIEYVHDTPVETLQVNGIHISSCYNRHAEAELQARFVEERCNVVSVYGIGTGDLINELLKRKEIISLNVVILSKALFKTSVEYFDHCDWLRDSRVFLRFVKQPGLDELKAVARSFCVVPASLRLADRDAERFRDLIELEINTPFINERFLNSNALRQQIDGNRELIKNDSDVVTLFNSHTGSTAYVVGAGATLEDSYNHLKNIGQGEFIIAVDAALRPLGQQGIYADYAVTVDGQYIPLLAFFNIELDRYKETPLIYFPVVHRKILELWEGPRYAAYSNSPIYEKLRNELPKGILFSSGSVIHPAVDLAINMGATTVKLVGTDFGFTKGLTHAAGCLASKPIAGRNILSWVTNGDGEDVPTTASLKGYLRDLEYLIDHRKGVRFINMSRSGARIEGTDYDD